MHFRPSRALEQFFHPCLHVRVSLAFIHPTVQALQDSLYDRVILVLPTGARNVCKVTQKPSLEL